MVFLAFSFHSTSVCIRISSKLTNIFIGFFCFIFLPQLSKCCMYALIWLLNFFSSALLAEPKRIRKTQTGTRFDSSSSTHDAPVVCWANVTTFLRTHKLQSLSNSYVWVFCLHCMNSLEPHLIRRREHNLTIM